MSRSSIERAAAVSLRQLRLFEAIGRLKSVRRASEECSLSQPAVTQALAKLEESIGSELVDRRASGSYLNEAGTILHARICRFFDQMENAVASLGPTLSPRSIVSRLTRSQLRTIIAIIDAGGFEAAASTLQISGPSLQRSARDLESNVKTSLFYRTASGVLVSPTGTRFGTQVKLALQEIEWGVEEIDAASGEASRPLVIGAMPFGGSVLLAAALDEFLRLHPRADVRIVSDGAKDMGRSLRNGDVDLVIGLLPETNAEELASEPLAETPYAVVVRRGHPLLEADRVDLEELAACDWVIGTEGSSRRRCFDRMFAGRSAPQAAIATCSAPVIRQLLERSDRVTLMTTYELLYADGKLRGLAVEPLGQNPFIGITTRATWLPTKNHADFMNIVRKRVRDMPTGRPRLHVVR